MLQKILVVAILLGAVIIAARYFYKKSRLFKRNANPTVCSDCALKKECLKKSLKEGCEQKKTD